MNKFLFMFICLFLVMPAGDVFADMNAAITGGQWSGEKVILKDNGTWVFSDELINASFDNEYSMPMDTDDIGRNSMANPHNDVSAVAENGKQVILTMLKTWEYKVETDLVVVEHRM